MEFYLNLFIQISLENSFFSLWLLRAFICNVLSKEMNYSAFLKLSDQKSMFLWSISWPLRRTIHFLPWHEKPCKTLLTAYISVFSFITFSHIGHKQQCWDYFNFQDMLYSYACQCFCRVNCFAEAIALPGMSPAFSYHSNIYSSFVSLYFYFFWETIFIMFHVILLLSLHFITLLCLH